MISGKLAVVTGGSRGIGRSIVLALCAGKADCVFTYHSSSEDATSLERETAGLRGGRAVGCRLDVRDFEATKEAVEKIKTEHGRLDILVCNAGITRDRSLVFMDQQDWADVIDTNLSGAYNITRACMTTFLRQKSGSVVTISSTSGIHPLPGQVNYAASKAGLIGFTKCLAREVAPYNVRVNAVAPGFIDTDMTASIPEKRRDQLIGSIPAGRLGTPREVAEAVMFLLGDESGYITGQVLQVDGGLGM